MTDSARRALELVERDASARERFERAHGGPDAVESLRESVIPDAAARAARDEELAALRRTAFGRTSTPGDESRAAEAHAALAAVEQRARSERSAVQRGVAAVLEPAATEAAEPRPGPVDDGAGEGASRDIRPPLRWKRALPVAAAFVIGAVIAGSVASALVQQNTVTSPALEVLDIPVVETPESELTGDVAAAERWLAKPQTAEDALAVDFDDIVPESVHLVSGGPGANGSAWIARDVDGGLCLVVSARINGAYGASCSTPELFAQHGTMVTINEGIAGMPGVTASWDGNHVYLTLGFE